MEDATVPLVLALSELLEAQGCVVPTRVDR